MSLISPPPRKEGEKPSPSRKPDGISLDKQYLPRYDAVKDIYRKAKAKGNNFVVLGSPPSTGKTSLLQLLKKRLEKEKDAKVIKFPIRSTSVEKLIQDLADKGITSDEEELNKLQNTWLLIDDAQNAYSLEYNKFWEIVVKDGSASNAKGLFVVIAATYDLATSPSPVKFQILEHVDPNICLLEAEKLIEMHLEHWGHVFSGWGRFKEQVLGLSKLADESGVSKLGREGNKHHIGVIMAAIRAVDEKKSRLKDISEDQALDFLRGPIFASFLDRCYYFNSDDVNGEMKKYLQMALVSKPGREDFSRSAIGPLLRAGILNTDGKFSCLAANWYYNWNCFPGRPLDAPATLRELIVNSIGCMSSTRLCDAVQSGAFPKEAAFQQLMNEAMSAQLPARHVIIPEFNTRAVDLQDPLAKPVTGELDFYVNGDKQWCIEMLGEGVGIGEHLHRFKNVRDNNGNKGKYRKVQMKEYYVIDCRGPKKGHGASREDNKCTLYFEENFSKCCCEMKGYEDKEIHLMM